MEVVADKYKQTEQGLIPLDWNLKTISEISNPARGGSPRPAGDPKYFNGNYIPWLTVAALTNIPLAQLYVTETESCLTEEGSLHSRILEKETIIIANSGATLGVAKLLGIKCCANDGIAALLDFDKETSKHYLVYFINTQIKYLREVVATGNGQPNLNTGLIGNIKVPLPPTHEEQTAIAAALSDADALIRSLEKFIAKKRNIKQGAMQKLLQPNEGWEVKKFSEVFLKYPARNYQINSSEYEDSGSYPVIDQGKKMIVGYSDNQGKVFNCPVGGIIVFGDHTRILKYVDYDFIVGADGTQLISASKEYNNLFFFFLLQTKEIPNTGYNRHFKFLVDMEFIIPKSKEEQSHIATILSDMDVEINALETKLEKYRKIKLGMMQNLLTGKIRLI